MKRMKLIGTKFLSLYSKNVALCLFYFYFWSSMPPTAAPLISKRAVILVVREEIFDVANVI